MLVRSVSKASNRASYPRCEQEAAMKIFASHVIDQGSHSAPKWRILDQGDTAAGPHVLAIEQQRTVT